MPYATLKERYYHTAARNLFLNQEFSKILDAFSRKNIPLIPLKGIALIQQIRPDIGSRCIGDIDLLVKAGDIPEAGNLLQALGYSSPYTYFNPEKPYSIYLNSAVFAKPAKIPYFIHLHWHLLNTARPLFMYKIDMEEIWQKAQPQKFGDREILMLEPHQLIVYLSVHALNHFFNKISLFDDLQKAIEFYKDKLDWELVREVAGRWNATLPLYYSLCLTAKILNPAGLQAVLNTLRPPKVSKTAYKIMAAITGEKLGGHNLVSPLYLDMATSPLNKIKFTFLNLFPPPQEMRRMYSVDSKHSVFLYYFKRLRRGFVKFTQD